MGKLLKFTFRYILGEGSFPVLEKHSLIFTNFMDISAVLFMANGLRMRKFYRKIDIFEIFWSSLFNPSLVSQERMTSFFENYHVQVGDGRTAATSYLFFCFLVGYFLIFSV